MRRQIIPACKCLLIMCLLQKTENLSLLTTYSRFVNWIEIFFFFFFFFFFFAYLPSPKVALTPSGNYKPNARGSDACRGSNSFWTRTLDRYTRAGLSECVVSTMSGPPPKTTQDRTQTKDSFLTSPGIEPGPPGWKAMTLPTTPLRRRNKNQYKIFIKDTKQYSLSFHTKKSYQILDFPPFWSVKLSFASR